MARAAGSSRGLHFAVGWPGSDPGDSIGQTKPSLSRSGTPWPQVLLLCPLVPPPALGVASSGALSPAPTSNLGPGYA